MATGRPQATPPLSYKVYTNGVARYTLVLVRKAFGICHEYPLGSDSEITYKRKNTGRKKRFPEEEAISREEEEEEPRTRTTEDKNRMIPKSVIS